MGALLPEDRRRVSAENRVAVGGGDIGGLDLPHAFAGAHVVGIIAAEKDAVGAGRADQKFQRRLGVGDGVVAQAVEITLRRMFQMQFRLRPHLPAMHPAAALIGNEAAGMHHDEIERGITLHHAAEDQARRGNGGVERIADQVVEIIRAQPVGAGDIAGMDHHEGVELGGGRPDRLEARIVEILAVDVRGDHGAMQPELAHGAAQFVGRRLGRLHRQRGDAGETVGMLLAEPRDLVVLDGRGGDADGGVLIIEPGLRRHREQMHIDLGGIHVGEAALDIVAAARKRPVRHAGHFDHRIVVVIGGELEPELRDLLLQELDGRVGKDVGVGVDGADHCLSPGWRGMFCA